MQRFVPLVATMVLFLAGVASSVETGSAPAKPDSATMERNLREMLKIPADFKLAYLSTTGAVLSPEQFIEQASRGARFDVGRDDAHRSVTLKLEDASPAGEIGKVKRLPDFDLARLDGGRARSGDLTGQISLVNFFFEGCVPCIKEAPVLSAFRRKHPEYHYLAVTFESAAVAKRFVEQHHLDWPVAVDATPLITALQVKGYPTYLLVAADGRILGRGSGMDVRNMDDATRALADFEKWVSERLKARG